MRRRDEQGQVTMLIIGFGELLLMAVAVLVDASAAYLQRQGLDNLADGAALYGADLGSAGVYTEGLAGGAPAAGGGRRRGRGPAATSSDVGAQSRYPGIQVRVAVDPAGRSVTVSLEAPLDLPLRIPGSPARTTVGASSTAAVTIRRESPDEPTTFRPTS